MCHGGIDAFPAPWLDPLDKVSVLWQCDVRLLAIEFPNIRSSTLTNPSIQLQITARLNSGGLCYPS